MDIWNDLITL